MQTIRRTTQFKRDVRRLRRRGKDLDKLKRIISLLLSNEPLPERLRDHELSGRWRGVRDLHIEPDWILLYSMTEDELVLIRSGSHGDLFS